MKTARQRVWWGLLVAFALGVGLTIILWVLSTNPPLGIALIFVAAYTVASMMGLISLSYLDGLLKESKP